MKQLYDYKISCETCQTILNGLINVAELPNSFITSICCNKIIGIDENGKEIECKTINNISVEDIKNIGVMRNG